MVVQMIRAYISSVLLRKKLLELLRDADKLSSDDPYGAWCLLIKIDEVLEKINIGELIGDPRDYDILTRHYTFTDFRRAIQSFPRTEKIPIKISPTEEATYDWFKGVDLSSYDVGKLLAEIHMTFIRVTITEYIGQPAHRKAGIARRARPIIQDVCSLIDLINEIYVIGAKR